MYFDKIKTELKRNGLTIKEFCGLIEVSEVGVYKAVKNDSFRVSWLLKASQVLGVPVCNFFDCPPTSESETEKKTGTDYRDRYFSTLERCNQLLEENMELKRKLKYNL